MINGQPLEDLKPIKKGGQFLPQISKNPFEIDGLA